MSVKNELQNIISGNGSVRNGNAIQSITSFLRGKKKSVSGAEKATFSKVEETEILIEYIKVKSLWFRSIDNSKYIGEGAEQKIYESSDPKFVLKRNDGVFYQFWSDYLNNLLLHNYFFPHLAYELLGFSLEGKTLLRQQRALT